MRAAKLEINTQALQHNFKRLQQLAPNSEVLAVIKADGYGHGLIRVAKTFPQDTCFGVACLDEAITLRNAGLNNPIMLLEGFFDLEELQIAAELEMQSVIHHQYQVDLLTQTELAKPMTVWLKLDSGMHRLGLDPEEFNECYQLLASSSQVQQPVNLMSHFASADCDQAFSLQQFQLFNKLTQGLKGKRSMANSAGLLNLPESHFDLVRPGLLMYGCSPIESTQVQALSLQPVMRLSSQIIAIKTIKQGETVGYGGAWRAQQDTQIAVIAIGYGDGYPRHAKNGTPVSINGREFPIAGRVSMDMITVDLGENHNCSIGDTAVLWGAELPLERVAEWADTISYELMCGLTPRVHVEIL